MTTPLFHVRDVSLSFGGLRAVEKFNLTLKSGELHGLIGPNGAGKTTIFNLITGVYRPDSGQIELAGRPLVGLPPWRIAARGVGRTFQNIRLFPDLSVFDNVRIGCHIRARHNMLQSLLRTIGHVASERAIARRAHELLEAFDLADRSREAASSLPYGDQRRLEIARALATEPTLLLLDEPAAGMNLGEKAALRGLIRSLPERFGVTILLIEHDMGLVMDVCDCITVLDHGQVIACGCPEAVQKDPKVIEAYLGEPVDVSHPA